jgi:hyperosmotically inducible periplasmic protein
VSLTRPMVSLFAALAVAAPIAACSVFEGRQSVAEYADDSTITNSVRARFVEDPVVKAGDVGVTTMDGVVQLSGFVDSPTERARAGQIARGVKGVRQVRNNINVR